MNQYKRIVSYLYQYLNGEKGQNIGYARLEQKGRQCRVTIQMRAVETSFMPEAWLFKQGRAAIEYISIGRLSAHQGSLVLKIVTSAEDVCSSGHTASDFDGAVIYINDKEYYATTWTNESIYIGNKINMLDREAYKNKAGLDSESNKSSGDSKITGEDNNDTGDMPAVVKDSSGNEASNSTDNKITDNAAMDISSTNGIIKENTSEDKSNLHAASGAGINTGNINNEDSTANDDSPVAEETIKEPDIKTQDIEEDKQLYGCSACPYKNYDKKNEDFGVRILRNFPVMYPFRSGNIEESVRIEPKDIGCMPIRLWSFANNRFLLHGYYCYKHLIFAKLCNGCYALGVPGVYSEQESKRAEAFSFNEFQPVGPGKTIYGVFGYWLARIHV